MPMKDIEALRKKIDQIDRSVARLLMLRIETVRKIGKIKKTNNAPALDRKREAQVINNVKKSSQNNKFIADIYRRIIEYSRKIQK